MLNVPPQNSEALRLEQDRQGHHPWRLWGPYLSERQWGTVREDYSANGDAWTYFPHEHAHRRAYRWGEDGLAGISDDEQRLCLSLALWNGNDPILKERLFGLTNGQGNHGEDVKELYYYLDATPTHSYLKMLYKYPQRAFPYQQLVDENRKRNRHDPEFELLDSGIFDDSRYFDIIVEFAKASPHDVLGRVTATNRGPEPASLHVLPQLWFRNTWSWKANTPRPEILLTNDEFVEAHHPELGTYRWCLEGSPNFLFTENDTNAPGLFGTHDAGFFKDAFHDYIVRRQRGRVHPDQRGTKAGAHYLWDLPPQASLVLRWRLQAADPGQFQSTRSTCLAERVNERPLPLASAGLAGKIQRSNSSVKGDPLGDHDSIFTRRIQEADEFYAHIQEGLHDPEVRRVQRQAFAGMIWSKQFFNFAVPDWLEGDPAQPPPPPGRRQGRNHDWTHLNNANVISMPDKWEYPWYAAWDLAFHCLPFAIIDPEFAKHQLVLLTREWYMHPNGQLPAYEWNFSDVNPPVHAWATWRVFQIDRKRTGRGDLAFLERVFHKLLLNFTWWVNRKDVQGRNIFQGGFLGLDNIGVFDRSQPLHGGGYINQADATAWMAMFSLNMMRIALELALHNPVYQDIATKFFEHFLEIAKAMTNMGGDAITKNSTGVGLWDEQDEFYYDELILPNGAMQMLRVRSMVGLIPLFAVETIEPELLKHVPDFTRRLTWYLNYRPDLAQLVSRWFEPGRGERRLLSLLRGHRMKCLLRRLLDPNEFLSDFGIRSLSRWHRDHPFTFPCDGSNHTVA